jgi:uncharacterized protein (TIGR02444 family)
LALQDGADADVNMLLAAAWLGAEDHCWQPDEVIEIVRACAKWRALCLLPLRKIRHNLKELVAADNWYQRIKALELEAERHQLHWIEDAALHLAIANHSNDQPSAIEYNLNVYLATLPLIADGHYRCDVALLAKLLSPPRSD